MRIIAHRSGPTIYPEQTVKSAILAKENGADMIEIDVRFTKEEKIAICHDENAERIFGINKKIREITAEEFGKFSHKNDKEFTSHFFEDYVSNGIEPLLIHIKEDEVIDSLLEIIEKYEYLDKVVFGVQSVELVKKLKKCNSLIKVLAFIPNLESMEEFGETDVDYIRLWESWLDIDNAKRVREYDKELWIMTNDGEVGVTTPENIEKILSFNVDAILINDITLLTKFREAK